MTFRFFSPAILAVLFAATAVQAAQIHIEGATEAAGVYELNAGARLADGLLLARPNADAYLLGTSPCRPGWRRIRPPAGRPSSAPHD